MRGGFTIRTTSYATDLLVESLLFVVLILVVLIVVVAVRELEV